MYKRKLTIFAALLLLLIAATSALVFTSTRVTRDNIDKNIIAQSLLSEHLQLSSTSYRLFKQLTDELIFGKEANQADVRNKRQIITQSLESIRLLEQRQEQTLGIEITAGIVKNTNDLEELINYILEEFNNIIESDNQESRERQERIQQLLEVTIDNRFREVINAAVNRQQQIVASLNARIDILNTSIFWYSILLATLAVPIVALGCIWLISILYHPLNSIRSGAEAIASGNYSYRLPRGFDSEFDAIAASFNSMAEKLAEQQQKTLQSKQELEYEVAQRTSELTETNKLLELNDNARRAFLADISHELRTPLTIIRGEAQVTLRQAQVDSEDYKTTLNTILDQSLSLSKLVDDLLLIARADTNNLRLFPQPLAICQFMQQVCDQYELLLSQKGLSITLHCEDNEVILSADADRLNQVMGILIGNAIEHSSQGQEITLHCQRRDDRMELIVEDQGEGIDKNALPHIFERFFRASDTRSGKGAGLGLAIAKAIVNAHEGTIKVDSEKGMGSRFTISLPLSKA